MRRTYRYRLYPTRAQVGALERQLGEACDLYNAALQQHRDMWRERGKFVGYRAQSAELRTMRAAGLIDPSANFWSQQAVLRRLDCAFAAFFRRVEQGERPGYPRFRSARRFATLDFSFAGNAGGVELTDVGRLRLQGVGHVKVKLHRPDPDGARLCQASVSRRNGRWYVGISVETPPAAPQTATGRAIGIDLGIKSFVTTSDGEVIAGPRANRAGARSVRRDQRKVSRRQPGSRRRRKAAGLVARHREHEANVRRDHAHKTARRLVERYDTIYVEDLQVRRLTAGMLAKDCADQGWASFVARLAEKAEEAARQVIQVDARYTSQMCSACGAVVSKALGVRVHSCACGYVADRDVNAARNVLARGLGCSPQARTVGAEVRAVA